MDKACFLAAVLVAQGAGLVQEPAQNPEPAKPKLICRSERGSRSLAQTQRICHTKEEWGQLASATERDMSNASRANGQSQAAMVPGPR